MDRAEVGVAGAATTQGWRRWEPLTGIAFVALFVGSVVASHVPALNSPDQDWVAAYTSGANQAQHVATGMLLVLAGLCLLSFLTILWTRIATLRRPGLLSPLPLVAAGVAAACIAVGGVLMAGISVTLLMGAPMPSADLLRFGDAMGFGMVGVGGMWAAALSIACASVQARSAGLFGRWMMVFGLVVAVVLLGSAAFVPILALLIWLIVVVIMLMRSRAKS